MNVLENIYQNSKIVSDYVSGYFTHLKEIIDRVDRAAVSQVIELMFKARGEGKNIFLVGNGGSAATASHFANDIAIGTRSPESPFRAISLTDNNSVMTAIGNDFGYENIFVKQLEAIFCDGDLIVAISASGNSPNVIKAIEYAKRRNGITIGLTGFDGGKLNKCVDYAVHVPTEKGEYGPVEDIHMIFNHIIGTYLMYASRAKE